MPRARGYSDCSFEKIVTYEGGAGATYARFTCVDCSKTLDLSMRHGASLAPIAYAKMAAREGWSVHPLKKAKVFCGACFSREHVNDPDSELKKVTLMSNVQPLSIPTPATKAAPVAAAPVVSVRDVTPETRHKIRHLLDKHFDDAAGAYLDGMSDEAVAEQLGIPRIAVEQLREAAYGPLKIDPVLSGLRVDLAQLKGEIEDYRAKGMRLEAAIMALGSKIEKRAVGK